MFLYFLINFIFSVRMIVNDKNVNQIIEKSSFTPVFCVCYSPYCGPCKKMHPFWIELMKLYAFDPYIIVAECDAKNNRDAALKLVHFSKFPTFALIIKGSGTILTVTHNLPSFISKAEEIKEITIDEKCKYFPNDFNNMRDSFPVISFPKNDNYYIDCVKLKKIAKATSLNPRLFFLSNSTSDPIIHYSSNKNTHLSNIRKRDELVKTIRDLVSNLPFSDYGKIKLFATKTSRKTIIFVYSDLNATINNFENEVYRLSLQYYVTKLHISKASKQFPIPELSNLPIIIIPDSKNAKYGVIKASNTNFASKITKDQYDAVYPYNKFQHHSFSFLILLLPSIVGFFVIMSFMLGQFKKKRVE